MAAPRGLRLTASLGVLLALTGVWLGHVLEYLRVWGTPGLDRALVGSAHAYMIPVGTVLALAAALAAQRAWLAWHRLSRRLDDAALALRLVLRGRRITDPGRSAAEPPSWQARILSLGGALGAVQVGLYVVQENLEALAVHRPVLLLGAVSGVHWAAALIQLDVALLLLAAVIFILRRLQRRAQVVRALEALVSAVRAVLRPVPAPRRGLQLLTPARGWLGGQAGSRAPPAAAAVR